MDPTGNTFVLVSSTSRFLDDEAYCRHGHSE